MRNILKRLSVNSLFWLTLIIFVSVPASLPLLRSGFYHFSDEPHIANLYEMVRAITSLQIPPRMAPDMSFGFGYPLFNFYYPLPYYLGSLFFSFTKSLVYSIKLIFLLTIPASGIAMYLWLKKHTIDIAAIVGATIYIYTPYRALDLYVRGALGETVAFVFFPLVMLAVDKLLDKPGNKNLGLLAITLGLFMLSHNLAPLIFIPFIIVYAIVRIFRNKKPRRIVKILMGLALGLLISSYWSFPAFAEKGLLRTQTPFNYADHFPFIKQLIFSKWGYGASVWGPNDDMSFQIGLVNIFLIVYTLVLLLREKIEKPNRKLLLFLLCCLFFVLFLMNIRSKVLWEIFPLADYVQFPWRLLMITTFLTSALVMFIKKTKLLILLGLLAVILNIGYFKPSGYFDPSDDYYLRRFFANRVSAGELDQISQEYFNYSEDYLLLPKWVLEKPKFFPSEKVYSENVKVENIKEVNSVNYEAKLKSDVDGRVGINFYYFPGWEVYLNGQKMAVKILQPYGNMGIDIPAGESIINVSWKETVFRKVMDFISLTSLIYSLALILMSEKRYENIG